MVSNFIMFWMNTLQAIILNDPIKLSGRFLTGDGG